MLRDPKQVYLPKWWWSPVPFYKYVSHDGIGWGTLVDRHPGMFNLAWAMSGEHMPPDDYQGYASKIIWVFCESNYIPMAGKTMADWAFYLDQAQFLRLLKKEAKVVKRWRFHDEDMSYSQVLQSVASSMGKLGA